MFLKRIKKWIKTYIKYLRILRIENTFPGVNIYLRGTNYMLRAPSGVAKDYPKYWMFMYGFTFKSYDTTIMISRYGLTHRVCNQICERLKEIRKKGMKFDEAEKYVKKS